MTTRSCCRRALSRPLCELRKKWTSPSSRHPSAFSSDLLVNRQKTGWRIRGDHFSEATSPLAHMSTASEAQSSHQARCFRRRRGFSDEAASSLDDWEFFSKAALLSLQIETIPEVFFLVPRRPRAGELGALSRERRSKPATIHRTRPESSASNRAGNFEGVTTRSRNEVRARCTCGHAAVPGRTGSSGNRINFRSDSWRRCTLAMLESLSVKSRTRAKA